MDDHSQRTRGLLALFGGVLALAGFWALGSHHLEGYRLGFGSVRLPHERMAYFMASWTLFGGAAWLLVGVGLAWLSDALPNLPELGPDASALPRDRTLVLAAAALALLVPVLVRALILEGAPVTDDESAYRFMAELIASGRVAAESPPAPLKLFFDRFQMVNDGSRYAQYFLGWPALMAPGVWLGIEEWMNAIYAALAVPALYGVARQIGDRWSGLAAGVLYVTSPFLMVAAATLGSHTSCFTALAWTYWAFFRTRAEPHRPGPHALFAICFSVAFFIRPLAALGIGGPLLVSWLVQQFRDREDLARRVLAFALPAAAFAALFLWVNYAQTGSPWSVAYTEFLEYAKQNGGRFVGVSTGAGESLPNLAFSDPVRGAGLVAAGLLRFDTALFGWPLSLAFVVFAGLGEDVRLLWYSAASYLATRLFLTDAGIDLFGPVHFAELALPALLLTALGVRRLADLLVRLRSGVDESRRSLRALLAGRNVGIFLGVAILLAGLFYAPVRLGSVARAADNTRRAGAAVEEADPGPAVVFAPRPFVPNCLGEHARHFVFWRPLNDPDLRSEILWVNHVTLEHDRRFMEYAPDRKGYVLGWTKPCDPHLFPLDSSSAEKMPDAPIGGSGEGPDWSQAPSPNDYTLPRPSR